jgi:hypothetical protein
MPRKYYIIAIPSHKHEQISPGWVDQLRRIDGVEVHGVSPDQVRIAADEATMRKIRATLNADFLIEEEVPRSL